MKLTGPKHEKRVNALKGAFTTPEELGHMMQHKLSENIQDFTYGDLQNRVFLLIQKEQAYERISDLEIGTRQANSVNLDLLGTGYRASYRRSGLF